MTRGSPPSPGAPGRHRPASGARRRRWFGTTVLIVLAAAAALSIATTVATGHKVDRGPRLISVAEGVGASQEMWRPNAPVSTETAPLCLSKPGKVTLEAVIPIRPTGGFTVSDFTVIPVGGLQMRPSTDLTPLARAAKGLAQSRTVEKKCNGANDEVLYLELLKDPTVDRATSHGFTISYRTTDGLHQAFVDYGWTLCGKGFSGKPQCEPILTSDK